MGRSLFEVSIFLFRWPHMTLINSREMSGSALTLLHLIQINTPRSRESQPEGGAASRAIDMTGAVKDKNPQQGSPVDRCGDCLIVAEAHHRIANNLGLIAAYARLKGRSLAREAPDAVSVRAVLESVASQIVSVANLHRALMSTATVRIDLACQLRTACEPIFSALEGTAELVDKLGQDHDVDARHVLPLTQIVVEAVTNALKHGRPRSRKIRIELALEKRPAGLAIRVQDNGPGFPDERTDTAGGMGLGIIKRLAAQIGARVTIRNNGGGCIEIEFDPTEAAAQRAV
jgi:two-component sensor histidine kinase